MAEEAKWYVVHTYSGYENAVKTTIEKFVAGRHLEDMVLDIRIRDEKDRLFATATFSYFTTGRTIESLIREAASRHQKYRHVRFQVL